MFTVPTYKKGRMGKPKGIVIKTELGGWRTVGS